MPVRFYLEDPSINLKNYGSNVSKIKNGLKRTLGIPTTQRSWWKFGNSVILGPMSRGRRKLNVFQHFIWFLQASSLHQGKECSNNSSCLPRALSSQNAVATSEVMMSVIPQKAGLGARPAEKWGGEEVTRRGQTQGFSCDLGCLSPWSQGS